MNAIPDLPVSRRNVLRAAAFGAVAATTPLAVRPAVAEPPPAGPAAAPDVWVHGAADRMFPTSTPTGNRTVALAAARNEQEAAQVMVRGAQALSGVTVTATDLTGPGGAVLPAGRVTVRRQYPHPQATATGGDNETGPGGSTIYYDALVGNEPATVAANTTLPYHVAVTVPANQAPGRYTGTVTVATSAGNVTVPLAVTVYDVAVPAVADATLKMNNWFTSAGWDYAGTIESIPLQYGCQRFDDRWWTVIGNIARNHARHRNNVIFADFQALLIPHTTIDDAGRFTFGWQSFDRFVQLFADAGALGYLYTPHLLEGGPSGPVVEILQKVNGATARVLVEPNSAAANAYFDQVLPALKQHLAAKGWDGIFYVSALDEPSTAAQVAASRWLYDKCRQHLVQIRNNEAHNHWVPDLHGTLQTVTPTPELYQQHVLSYQQFRLTPGKELWLYTCIIPQGDHMNRFLRFHLDKTRLIPWLLWKIGATGYLHWGWNYWVVWNGSRWVAPDTFNDPHNGDAWLVRPNKAALDIHDSLRSEAQLDGIEDYELLNLLAARKPVTAHAIANSLIVDTTRYTRSGEDVVQAHRHLLDALTSSTSDGRFPLRDGFADARNWVSTAGSWSVSGGAYRQTDAGAAWGLTSALRARAYGDFAATVDVQVTAVNASGGDTNWAGLMVRSANASDMDSGYLVALRRNGEVFIYRAGQQLGRASVPGYSASGLTRLKVVAQGTSLTVCAGPAAKPILTVTDAAYRYGNIALVTGGASAQFQAFAVNAEQDYAEGKPVTVSSSYEADGWSKTVAVNGTAGSVTGALGWSSAKSTGPDTPQWIRVDLGRTYPVGRIDLYGRTDGAGTGVCFPVDFRIEVSTDGTAWTSFASRTAYPRPGAGPQAFTRDSIQARYVRVTATKLSADGFGNFHCQLSTIACYGGNLAAGRPVTTSSSYESLTDHWGRAALTDGASAAGVADLTGWSSVGGTSAARTEWAAVDLGAASRIAKVVLHPRTDRDNAGMCFPVDFRIEGSVDGTTWTALATRTGHPAPDTTPQVFTFAATTARHVRVVATSLSPDDHGSYHFQLSELEVHAA